MSLTKSYFPKALKRHLTHTLSLSSFHLYLLRTDPIYSKLKINSHLMLQPVSFSLECKSFHEMGFGKVHPLFDQITTGHRLQWTRRHWAELSAPHAGCPLFSPGPLCVPRGGGRAVGSGAGAGGARPLTSTQQPFRAQASPVCDSTIVTSLVRRIPSLSNDKHSSQENKIFVSSCLKHNLSLSFLNSKVEAGSEGSVSPPLNKNRCHCRKRLNHLKIVH